MARQPRKSHEDNGVVGEYRAIADGAASELDGGPVEVDTGAIGDAASDRAAEAPRPRRGRRTKAELEAAGEVSASKTRKKGDVSLDKGLVAGFLMMANNLLAAKAGAPHFFIGQGEGELLGGAVYDVLDHYGYAKWVGKYGVWANLAAAIGTVYMPKMGLSLAGSNTFIREMAHAPTAVQEDGMDLAGQLAGAWR